MTFVELLDAMTAAALAEPNVNHVSSNPVTELNTLGAVDYAAVYLNLDRVEVRQDVNVYYMDIIYIDRVNDSRNDQRPIQSVGIMVISDILNRLDADNVELSINHPYTITPYWQKFADVCSGVYATVGITVTNFGECYE